MPNVAEVVAQTLAAYGTEKYFCFTGGDHHLWMALREVGISIINARSESGAVYMADGYARVSGRPGFVYGQRGPGVANVAGAMADPYWAMSPVISLTSSIALRSRDRFEYQDADGLAMHGPVTIWNKSLASPERAADMVRAAIRVATGPVPGPVHLEIPGDMLGADAGASAPYREAGIGSVNGRRPIPDRVSVKALIERLTRAERPLIVAGNGVVISEAWEELTRFAELLSIPVATTLGGKGSISEEHDLAVGVAGRYSRRVANELVREADTILAIGTRLGGLATVGWQLPFGEKHLIQVDTDPLVIGHNYPVELGFVGDAKLTLQFAIDEMGTQRAREKTSWAKTVAERVNQWQAQVAEVTAQNPSDGIHPAAVIAALREIMAPDDLLAADTGAIAAWAGALFPIAAGRNMLRSAGSLGWVVPGTMGAALAAPHRRSVALTGDGGLLYHIAELETALRCNIPVVIVVLNNRALASEYHILKHRLGVPSIPEIIDFIDVDFANVATAFGAFGRRVSDRSQLASALQDAFDSKRPALVDVLVSKEAVAPADVFRSVSIV